MKFVIRDDDTNFFTAPKRLELIYANIWEEIPISFSVIPFVSSEANSGDIPNSVRGENKLFPIGRNEELVSAMKLWIREKRIEIMQHGYAHTFKEYAKNNYEVFVKTIEAKRYLEKVFGTQISVFVPPNNSFSLSGSKAVIKAGMNILMAFSHFPWERPLDRYNFINFIKMLNFYLRYGKKYRYPKPLRFKNHWEFGCYILGPSTTLEELKDGFLFSLRNKGDFCLATHYYAFFEYPRMRDILYQFIDWILKNYKNEVKFVKASDLFRKSK